MLEALKKSWWLLVLRGVVALLLGILCFAWPGASLASLVLLFGFYALINGVFTLAVAIRAPKGMPGLGTLILLGLLGIAAGILTFMYPGITALSLLYVIAFWAIATGIFEILVAIKLRQQMSHEGMLILSGILSVAFGVLAIMRPGAGALSIVWLIGTYAVLWGILLLTVAFRVKGGVSSARAAIGAA